MDLWWFGVIWISCGFVLAHLVETNELCVVVL